MIEDDDQPGRRENRPAASGSAPASPSRKWPVFLGLALLAAGVGTLLIAYTGPAKDSIQGGIFGFAKDPVADCAHLATNAIAGGQDQYGEPLGLTFSRMAGPAAIAACTEAVKKAPEDAKTWRRLGRAYMAAMSHDGYNEAEYRPEYAEAFRQAINFGDIPAFVLSRIVPLEGSASEMEVLSDTRDAIDQLQGVQLKGPEDYFYKAVLVARNAELEARNFPRQRPEYESLDSFERDEMEQQYRDERGAEAKKLFKVALRKGGSLPFFLEYWELKLSSHCEFVDYICDLSKSVFVEEASPSELISASGYLIREAYRITDLQYQDVDTSEKSVSRVRDNGLAVAANASYYARIARARGGTGLQGPADAIFQADRAFQAYAGRRYRVTAEEARQARQAAWLALGAAVLGAIANAKSDGRQGAPEQQSVSDYIDSLNTQMCNSMALEQSWGGGASGYELKRMEYGC